MGGYGGVLLHSPLHSSHTLSTYLLCHTFCCHSHADTVHNHLSHHLKPPPPPPLPTTALTACLSLSNISRSSSKCLNLISSFFICDSTNRATKLLILHSSTLARCCVARSTHQNITREHMCAHSARLSHQCIPHFSTPTLFTLPVHPHPSPSLPTPVSSQLLLQVPKRPLS